LKLIIVDDEIDIRFLFQQKFRKEIKSGEMQIHFALNGFAALELLESIENHKEYFILTDINMPEMTGLELLKEIKLRYPTLKVIMVTAYGDEQYFNLAKQLGAEDYFTKPLEFNLLKSKLKYLETV
jgi:YesN/AraC family two-component response regulator